jgi:hypothetical protein
MSSWSCKSCFAGAAPPRSLLILLVFSFSAPVLSAEYYVQPVVTALAETNSNIQLNPSGGTPEQGYGASASALIGIATPNSDTNVRPQFRYAYYAQEPQLNRLESIVDFNTVYRSQVSSFSLSGRFDQLNDTNAQKPSAQFSELNPSAPGTSDAGHVQVGVTRDYLILQPRYTHQVSQLISLGVSALYQTEFFTPSDLNGHVNFDYYLGQAFITRKFGERMVLRVGGIAARYEARDVVSTSNATGAELGMAYKWTEALKALIVVTWQHSDVNSTLTPAFQGTTDNWGASGELAWIRSDSTFRLNLGRTITPGSAGGTYSADQLHVQYDRKFSERLSGVVAGRAVATRGLWANIDSSDRNYVTTDLSAKWMLTRTWIVQGGYNYFWQKYRTNPLTAHSNSVYLQIGYQGLPPQR